MLCSFILSYPQSGQSASMFYKMMARALYDNNESLRQVWQRDLQVKDKDSCQKIISRMGWFTREARRKFTHYKILHRYYFTPARLFKMGLQENSLCWKCKRIESSFI